MGAEGCVATSALIPLHLPWHKCGTAPLVNAEAWVLMGIPDQRVKGAW
jgi:hypothetical protein